MFSYIAKSVSNDHLGSTNDPCYIQNRVITNRVIKRLRCVVSTVHKISFLSFVTVELKILWQQQKH